jgi:hypothetical protein
MPLTVSRLRGLASSAVHASLRALGHNRPDGGPEPDGVVTYSEADLRARERYRGNYATLCAALDEVLDFRSLLDLGCANGFVLDEMMCRGKDVAGVEVSAAVVPLLPESLRGRVTIADATALGPIGTFDLVSCIEVAEHIPPERTAGLLDTIAANARRWVYFTAASPYQPGHGHVNCRPQFYWLNEFRKRGFRLEWERTERFIGLLGDLRPAVWLPLNSLILSRA